DVHRMHFGPRLLGGDLESGAQRQLGRAGVIDADDDAIDFLLLVHGTPYKAATPNEGRASPRCTLCSGRATRRSLARECLNERNYVKFRFFEEGPAAGRSANSAPCRACAQLL